MRPIAVISILAVCVVAGAGARTVAQGQTPPPGGPPQGRGGQAPTNLKVLPKEMTGPQVMALMRTFTAALGVTCTECHVSQQDRASDDKPLKGTARKMLQMTMHINDEHLKGVGEPPAAGTTIANGKVTCYTCHRGARKPLNAPPPAGGGL